MLTTLMRVLLGFVVACLTAGAAQVLFAFTPPEVLAMSPDEQWSLGERILLTATHTAVFAAPFLLIAAAISEWQALRSWAYHALAGIAIAIAGFIAQFASEASGEATIVNTYAMTAFLVSGFLGGMAYWLTAGRRAGGPDFDFELPMDRVRLPPTPPAPPPPSRPSNAAGGSGSGSKGSSSGSVPSTGTKQPPGSSTATRTI